SPEFKGYGSGDSEQESNVVCDKESDNSKENSDESLVEEQVSQDKSSFVESSPNVDKETVFPINCDNHQRRGIVSRNNYNRVDAKTTHPSVHRNMSPKAVLLKTGLTPLNTVRDQTTLTRRSVHAAKRHYYTGRPKAVNTARSYTGQVNVVRVKGVNAVKGKPQHDDKGLILQKITTARQKLMLLRLHGHQLQLNQTHLGISKEVETPRYLSLVVPLTKVGDEAVHKELGDRMERAATTASSLEAEQDSVNAARPNLVLPVQVNAAEGDSINTSIQDFI
ncbi:hypothetical protein Tco_0879481, partial [Tanacetum coccineum]